MHNTMKQIVILLVMSFMGLGGRYIADRSDDSKGTITGSLSYETQNKIKSNVLQISENFFTNRDEFEAMSDNIERYLDALGPRSKAYGNSKIIDISIVSGGGRVSWYKELDTRFGKRLKEAHVRCTVGYAGSMAFTFMVHFCDERLFSPDTFVMQHQVYMSLFGAAFYNDATVALSLYFSDIEAEALGLPKDIWWYVSREQGDKFFNNQEEYTYNLRTN